MKTFLAFAAAVMIAAAACNAQTAVSSITLNDYAKLDTEARADLYANYLKALVESPKLPYDLRAFILKEYFSGHSAALEALNLAVRDAEDNFDGETPVKNVIDHEIKQRYTASLAAK